jgi:hypothetical protein
MGEVVVNDLHLRVFPPEAFCEIREVVLALG